MSPQEFYLIAEEKSLDAVAGAGGLTRREIADLQSMLEAPDPREAITDDA
jgi:hypothetical protein